MFEIPKVVKIGGFNYKVYDVKHLNRDRNRSGESCGNTQEIKIDPDDTQQARESTFIHEILEQFNFVYDMNLEHHQIYLLEAAIFAFLKDNLIGLKMPRLEGTGRRDDSPQKDKGSQRCVPMDKNYD